MLHLIKSNNILLPALLLIFIAAVPRLHHLGELGFYMDEETTAFASRSMAETGSPKMPSGMPYYRSLPHTWLNSLSVGLFGPEHEISYRLPGALLGILTIPLVFFLTRPFTGTTIAFVASLLLALSEWHIITSRQARMYAPFLFFYVACSFSILHWSKKDTLPMLAGTVILFMLATTFHNLGVFLAFIPLITLFIKDFATTAQYKLVLFSIVAGAASYIYGEIFVAAPYSEWLEASGITKADSAANKSLLTQLELTKVALAQAIGGLAIGVWLGIRSAIPDHSNGKEFRSLARYSLSSLLGLLAATGNLYGAFMTFVLLLFLYPDSLTDYLRKHWQPLAALIMTAAIASTITIHEQGITPGIKALLLFPYPNWITLYQLSPGIALIFFAAMLYQSTKKKTASDWNIISLTFIGLFPIILVGIVMKWAAARYLIMAYPFILIACALLLCRSAEAILKRRSANFALTSKFIVLLIALSGILGGHGLVSAYMAGNPKYGDKFNETALIFPLYPDHKTPGLFVAKHRKPTDTVIAEDVLTQRWYAGNIDYWLRQYSDTGGVFLYKADDGNLHDIYVNSTTATNEMLELISSDQTSCIWLITSAETYAHRDWYLTVSQQQWLENIEQNEQPVITGLDGITNVYLLNCERLISKS